MATLPPTVTTQLPTDWSLADLQRHLGDIPLERILLLPPAGTATVDDVERLNVHHDRLCELIDGVLVEKTMGFFESQVALIIGFFLQSFLEEHDLGIVAGADGALQILSEQVRIPDVSFIRWERFPNRELPAEPIPDVAPDLAVEVLSKSNTPAEMQRKLRDYFAAGVQLVWTVDAAKRTATVYTAPEQSTAIPQDGTLHGGDVLPGLEISLHEVFERAGKRPPRPSDQ